MANQQALVNFLPILRFHFTIRYMTKEALRKMIKEYQLGLREDIEVLESYF
jgi:hypothetical protein